MERAKKIEPPAIAVSVPRAARVIGISPSNAWARVKSGELPSFRVGRRRLVRVSDLEAFAAGRTATP